jgi:hypothetical protein
MIRDLSQFWSIPMATNEPGKHSANDNGRGPGYETRDASIPALLKFAFWMALTLIVTLVGMKLTFNHFKKIEPMGPTASPMVSDTYRMLPPSPRLQAHPRQELKDYCAAQEQEVDTYGWVDQPSGVTRIPIDRAIALTLERGLPARPAAEAPTGAAMVPTTLPTVPEGADVGGPCDYVNEKYGRFAQSSEPKQ